MPPPPDPAKEMMQRYRNVFGRPARRCGARIETSPIPFPRAVITGRPARRCGARIETAFVLGGNCDCGCVAPHEGAGRGLKQCVVSVGVLADASPRTKVRGAD